MKTVTVPYPKKKDLNRQSATIKAAGPARSRDWNEKFNTYDVTLEIDDGFSQSFGGLYLPDGTWRLFERDLLECADVPTSKNLIGLRVHALYYFGRWNEPICGLEFDNGSKFLISKFQRDNFPANPPNGVLKAEIASLERDIEQCKNRLADLQAKLLNVGQGFVDWDSKI